MNETKKLLVTIAAMLAGAGVSIDKKKVDKEMKALNDALTDDDGDSSDDDDDDADEKPKKGKEKKGAAKGKAKGKSKKDDDDEDDDDSDDEDEDDDAPFNPKKITSYSRDQLIAYGKAKKVKTTGLKMAALREEVTKAYAGKGKGKKG